MLEKKVFLIKMAKKKIKQKQEARDEISNKLKKYLIERHRDIATRLINVNKDLKKYKNLDDDSEIYLDGKQSPEYEFLLKRQRVYTISKKCLERYIFNGFKSSIDKK